MFIKITKTNVHFLRKKKKKSIRQLTYSRKILMAPYRTRNRPMTRISSHQELKVYRRPNRNDKIRKKRPRELPRNRQHSLKKRRKESRLSRRQKRKLRRESACKRRLKKRRKRNKRRQKKPQESLRRKSKRGLLPKKLSRKPDNVRRMRKKSRN